MSEDVKDLEDSEDDLPVDVEDAAEEEPAEELDENEAEETGEVSEDAEEEQGEPARQEEEPEDDGVLFVSLEDDAEEEEVSAPIRQLRDKNKEQHKRIKELEAKLSEEAPAEAQLGPEPTLEAFDYDTGKFKAALIDWTKAKERIDAEEAKKREAQEKADQRYTEKHQAYTARKGSLGVKGFDEVESTVIEALPKDRQSVIVAHAKDPALVVLALGKNPKVLEDLASAPDLIDFTYKLASLEAKMKVTGKKVAAPEKRVKGRAAVPVAGSEKKLEKLRAEAEKTGDFTQVHAYRRQMKAQG